MVVSGMQGLDCTTWCHLLEIDERQERIVIRAEAARKPPSRDETKKTAHEDMIERGMRAERTTPGGDICRARRVWKCTEHDLDSRFFVPQPGVEIAPENHRRRFGSRAGPVCTWAGLLSTCGGPYEVRST